MTLINDPAIWFKDLFVHAGLGYSLSSFLSTVALVLTAYRRQPANFIEKMK